MSSSVVRVGLRRRILVTIGFVTAVPANPPPDSVKLNGTACGTSGSGAAPGSGGS
jgi:hypothetical protein